MRPRDRADPHHIDAGVAEIRRAHGSGLRGLLLPAFWRPFPAYDDDRGTTRSGRCARSPSCRSTPTPAPPLREDIADDIGIYTTETIGGRRALWFLLWSGVFERYPGLNSR